MDGYVLIWLIFCGAVGYWANQRGRSPLLWGLLSMFLSPILAGVVLAMMKDKKQADEILKVQTESQQLQDRVTVNEVEVNDRISKVEERVLTLETGQEPAKLGQAAQAQILEEGKKKCPFCGEFIRKEAIKCRYCGGELPEIKMVECPFCKELIREDAAKCKYCRSDIPQITSVDENTPESEA